MSLNCHHLSDNPDISHARRTLLGLGATLDHTGSQMVLVMKLITLAWNVHDGRLKPEVCDPRSIPWS